jgi:hypothetical protein
MKQILTAETVPTSFGVFKPVGYVMLGLPNERPLDGLVAALHAGGWHGDDVLHFTPRETVSELEAMVAQAGPMAGFGYEITLLRRYLELARAGQRWLLVKVDDTDHAAVAADIARGCGATLAVHYRTLTVEELI